jgi:hypothetical protein
MRVNAQLVEWAFLLCLLLPIGCQSPVLTFTASFAIARDYRTLQLEVRPENPYSVILRVVMRENKLYIDAAEGRRWHTYMKANPSVRIKLGDHIYKANAVKVTSPEIIDTFIQGRTIYELVPRP